MTPRKTGQSETFFCNAPIFICRCRFFYVFYIRGVFMLCLSFTVVENTIILLEVDTVAQETLSG